MASKLWELFVQLSADSKPFRAAMKDAEKTNDEFAKSAVTATSLTDKAFNQLSGNIIAYGSKLAAGLGLAQIGYSAIEAAEKMEEVDRRIARATGQTGDSLKGLQQSFRNLYVEVPASAESISAALTMISQRTGATGAPLEKLTAQMLKLAKVGNEDVAAVAPVVTRVFGDWSIATEDQARAMDFLRVTSQQTGVTVSRLSEQIVFAGAPLRQLGFSFEEAATLFAKFEKEGVNVETLISGFRFATGKWAQENKNAKEEFRAFVEGVATGTKTLSDAVETFGKRAANDMFRAMIEGRFEIQGAIDKSHDLAKETAKTVKTVSQEWTSFKRTFEVNVLEPMGAPTLHALTYLIEQHKIASDKIKAIWTVAGSVIANIVSGKGATFTASEMSVAGMALARGAVYGPEEEPKADPAAAIGAQITQDVFNPRRFDQTTIALEQLKRDTVAAREEMRLWEQDLASGRFDYELLELGARIDELKNPGKELADWITEVGDASIEAAVKARDLEQGLKDIDAIAKNKVSDMLKQGWPEYIKQAGKEMNEFERHVRRTFDSIASHVAKNIVEWKGWKESVLSIGKDLATGFLQIIVRNMIKPLEDQFAKLAANIGNVLLGKGWGGAATGGATSAAGGAVSASGAGASGAGSAVSGVAGWVGAIGSAVSAVSGVIGNFQFAGMNKTLDLIENYTRYTKIYLGEQSDSVLESIHVIRNVATDYMRYVWDVQTPYYQKMTAALEGGGTGGGGARASFVFNNCNFGGAGQANITAMMNTALTQYSAAFGR